MLILPICSVKIGYLLGEGFNGLQISIITRGQWTSLIALRKIFLCHGFEDLQEVIWEFRVHITATCGIN